MKNAVIVIAILSITGKIVAQELEIPERKKLMFGFNLGLNYSNVLTPRNHALNTKINNGGGFRVGVIMSEEISKKMNLSPKAELSFNDCNVEYSNTSNSRSTYRIYPVNLDFMLHFTYQFQKNKYSPYILMGPNARIPLIESEAATQVHGNSPDFAIDLGFGLEKALPYFYLAPELRYSFGLLNVNKDPGLNQVYFHNVTFVLNFKG